MNTEPPFEVKSFEIRLNEPIGFNVCLNGVSYFGWAHLDGVTRMFTRHHGNRYEVLPNDSRFVFIINALRLLQ